MIGIAVRVLELILWEFEATPDAIIFRLVGEGRGGRTGAIEGPYL